MTQFEAAVALNYSGRPNSRSFEMASCVLRGERDVMRCEGISVLLVAEPSKDCNEIERLLRHTQWNVYRATSVAQAGPLLSRVPVQVLLCQNRFRDGRTWRDVLNAVDSCNSPASVVVLSEPEERIWGEVLNLGGYDLLPVPCEPRELYSMIPEAWRRCIERERDLALCGA